MNTTPKEPLKPRVDIVEPSMKRWWSYDEGTLKNRRKLVVL